MSYVNNYTPPPETRDKPFPSYSPLPDSELYGPTPYDINFAYPIHEDTLQSDRLKLVPFVPSVHAESYWQNVSGRADEVYRYYPFLLSTLHIPLPSLLTVLPRLGYQPFFILVCRRKKFC